MRTERQKRLYSLPSFSLTHPKQCLKALALLPQYRSLKRKHALFENFLADELKMTREYDSLEAIERDQLNYDCYISGGDQCWNTVPSDFDWSYYLPFVKSGRKISYGISMGPFAERAITSREKIGSLLKTYDAISVREEGTKKMVDSLVSVRNLKYILIQHC